MSVISPEQRLRNLSKLVVRLTTPNRLYNGRGREASYAASKAEIAQAARQLAEEIQAYLNGELSAIDSESPF